MLNFIHLLLVSGSGPGARRRLAWLDYGRPAICRVDRFGWCFPALRIDVGDAAGPTGFTGSAPGGQSRGRVVPGVVTGYHGRFQHIGPHVGSRAWR